MHLYLITLNFEILLTDDNYVQIVLGVDAWKHIEYLEVCSKQLI